MVVASALSRRNRNRNRNLFALGGGIGSLLGVVILGHRYFRAAATNPLPYPLAPEEEEGADPEEEEPPAAAFSKALNTTQEIAQEVLPAPQAQQVAQAANAIEQAAEKVSSPKERQAVQAAVANLVNNVAAAVEVAEEKAASPEAIPVLRQRRPTRSSQQKPATPAPRVIPGPTPVNNPRVIALDTVDLPPGETVTKLTDLENQTILDSLEAYFTNLVGALINVADDPVAQRKILLANLEYYEDKVKLIRKNLEKFLETPGEYTKEIRQADADLAARMLIPEIISDKILPFVRENTGNLQATLTAFLNQLRSTHLPRKLKLAVTEYQGLFPGGINGFRDWFEETMWNIPDETFKAAATMRKNLRESIDEILRTEQLKHGQVHASKINTLLREYFQTPNRPVADIESEKFALEKLQTKLENDRDNYFPAELASLQSQNATPEATADLMKAITKNQLQLQIIGSLLAQFEELAKKIKSQKPPLMGPIGRFVSQFAPHAVQNLLVPPEASPRKKPSRYPTRSRSRRRPS